jgi:hypothetical protein
MEYGVNSGGEEDNLKVEYKMITNCFPLSFKNVPTIWNFVHLSCLRDCFMARVITIPQHSVNARLRIHPMQIIKNSQRSHSSLVINFITTLLYF